MLIGIIICHIRKYVVMYLLFCRQILEKIFVMIRPVVNLIFNTKQLYIVEKLYGRINDDEKRMFNIIVKCVYMSIVGSTCRYDATMCGNGKWRFYTCVP